MGFMGLETLIRGSAEVSYEDGVEAVENVDEVVFIDPDMFEDALDAVGIDYDEMDTHQALVDAISNLEDDQKTALLENLHNKLEEFLEDEVPGSVDVLNREWTEHFGVEPTKGEIALRILGSGPMAIDNLVVGDTKYGFAVLPVEFIDTKDKVVDFFLADEYDPEVIATIKENMPGSTGEWQRLIGYHEGGHLDGVDGEGGSVSTLEGEAHSDRVARENMIADGDGDVALAFKDLRALSDGSADPEHATGPLLRSGDPASSLHLEIAESYNEDMYRTVQGMFDWENYEGEATTSEDLIRENPDAFFKTVNEALEDVQRGAMEAYNENPTGLDEKSSVVAVQILTDYVGDFEGAYRRRVLGDENFPDNEPTQMIPQSEENEVYAHLKHENAIEAIAERHTQEMASTENYNVYQDPFDDFDWESYEGEATSPYDLLVEDPALYYSTQKDHLEEMKASALQAYAENPSLENIERMLEAQALIQKHAWHINRDLNREIEYTDLLSDESFVPEEAARVFYELELIDHKVETAQERALEAQEEAERQAAYNTRIEREEAERQERLQRMRPHNRFNRLKDPSEDLEQGEPSENSEQIEIEAAEDITQASAEEDKGYIQSPDGSAFTTEVDGVNGGEPNVDFKSGVSVAGMSMSNFFDQNVNPDPNTVTLVSAVEPQTDPDATIDPALYQQQDSTQSMQTLR